MLKKINQRLCADRAVLGAGSGSCDPTHIATMTPRTNRKLCVGLQDQQGAGLVSEVFKVELKDPEAGSIQRVSQKKPLFPAETIRQESTWTPFKASPDEDSRAGGVATPSVLSAGTQFPVTCFKGFNAKLNQPPTKSGFRPGAVSYPS